MQKNNYHTAIAIYFATKPHFFDGDLQKKPNIRKCSELPWQQTNAKLWDEVTETLCDLNFIQAKACSKQTYDLVKDYHLALDGLPEYQPEKEKERKRQERLDKYTQDLIACAKGIIATEELEIPESITPWTEKQLNAEIERIRTNPTRMDRLRDYINFLGREMESLQKFASEVKGFSIQQAYNYADTGMVHRATENFVTKINKLTISPVFLEKWNPKHALFSTFNVGSHTICALHMSVDEKILIAGDFSGNFYIFNLVSLELKLRIKAHDGAVNTVSISADGRIGLSAGKDGEIKIWDVKAQSCRGILTGHTDEILASAITADGERCLSGGRDQTLRYWDIENQKCIAILGDNKYITTLALSGDGKRVVSSTNILIGQSHTVDVWDLSAMKLIDRYEEGYYPSYKSTAINLDGTVIIAGNDDPNNSDIKIWSKSNNQFIKLDAHSHIISSLSLSADTRFLVSSSLDNTMKVWDIEAEQNIKTFRHKNYFNHPLSSSISVDLSKIVVSDLGGPIRVWNITEGSCIGTTKGHNGLATCAAIAKTTGIAVSGGWDHKIMVWDLRSGNCDFTLEHRYTINRLKMYSDGKKIIVEDGEFADQVTQLSLWDLSTKDLIGRIRKHCFPQWDFRILQKSNHILAFLDEGGTDVELWDMNKEKLLFVFKGHSKQILNLSIHPDENYFISTGEDQNIKLWDLENHQYKSTFIDNCPVRCSKILSDKNVFASGNMKGIIKIWSLSDEHLLHQLNVRNNGITHLEYSPIMQLLISADMEGWISVWDTKDYHLIFTERAHPSAIQNLTLFNRNLILSRGGDQSIKIWSLPDLKCLAAYQADGRITDLDGPSIKGEIILSLSSGEIRIIHFNEKN